MADIVSPSTRSKMMAGIKAKDTKPEMILRKALYRRGFRYRLHCKDLPGKPDLVFRQRKAIIFVHGCFWHGHNCPFFRLPSTRTDFWKTKIESNRKRDAEHSRQLLSDGWRVLTVWECAMRGKSAENIDSIFDEAASWLDSKKMTMEIRG